VVGLAVGDVLPLQHPATRPLDVVVDGVVLARAAVGSQGSRLACRVVDVEEENA
jgi:flagellar motor switch protein FliM